MTPIQANVAPSIDQPTSTRVTKTKAKKRYLKAKKERKKHRRAAAARSAAGAGVKAERDDAEEDGEYNDEGADGHASEHDEGSEMVVDVDGEGAQLQSEHEGIASQLQVRKKKHREKEKSAVATVVRVEDGDVSRPRKRRKLDSRRDTSPGHSRSAAAAAVDSSPPPPPPLAPSSPVSVSAGSPNPPDDSPSSVDDHRARTPTPPPSSLPRFPSLLARGLDRALARAQLVDPLLTTPLLLDEDGDVNVDGGDVGAGLSVRMIRRLRDLGIMELFAVQTTLLPLLLPRERRKRSLYLPYDPPSDICVSAPTGSGKTLAYVLPIVEILSTRAVTHLRALVVLPTRDLVIQVRETFEAIAKGRGLKIASVTGQHSFTHEQSQVVEKTPSLQGGSSKVDILICTPGRLMDHLNGTPNFSLQHLRFLVVDEADRLLAQSFQDWLTQVLAATRPPAQVEASAVAEEAPVPYPDTLSPSFLHLLRGGPAVQTDLDEKRESSCQKLLFSATLMNDPGRIAALELRNPRYVVVQSSDENQESGILGVMMEKFSMPATLKEHMIVCDSSQKPLVLFHLVHSMGIANALVFTKSAESTLRLVRLFEFFENARSTGKGSEVHHEKSVVVEAYSSDLSPSERKSILEKFKAQEIDMLVCSDLISRGIDIKHVTHVVNYDAPVDMRKYVHRVGRTARAGRTGDAWTLVEEQEARHFKTMIRAAGHAAFVSKLRVTDGQLAPLVPCYHVALARLKGTFTRAN